MRILGFLGANLNISAVLLKCFLAGMDGSDEWASLLLAADQSAAEVEGKKKERVLGV